MSDSIVVGDWVVAGKGDGLDYGVIHSLDGDIATVGWQLSGHTTEIELSPADVEIYSTQQRAKDRCGERRLTVVWRQTRSGNVHVTDGSDVGNWAEFPAGVTAQEALDAYLATADYSDATAPVTVTAEVLSGTHEGQIASAKIGGAS